MWPFCIIDFAVSKLTFALTAHLEASLSTATMRTGETDTEYGYGQRSDSRSERKRARNATNKYQLGSQKGVILILLRKEATKVNTKRGAHIKAKG
jgi:hypothetical protein